MKPSEIRSTLQRLGIELSKGMGQNFLHDSYHLDRFVGLAHLTEEDPVLEIGPGLGPVTDRILRAAQRVIAVEKDDQLYDWLKERFADKAGVLELIHADALSYLTEEQDWSEWKFISNLPYSVGTACLEKLFLHPNGPKSLTVTLQYEVIQRIRATNHRQPGFGPLSLRAALQYQALTTYKVPPSCFYPPPKVMSASLHLEKHSSPKLPSSHISTFDTLIQQGFSQRRKRLQTLLHKLQPLKDMEALFKEVSIAPSARAEELELGQWIDLSWGWKTMLEKK